MKYFTCGVALSTPDNRPARAFPFRAIALLTARQVGEGKGGLRLMRRRTSPRRGAYDKVNSCWVQSEWEVFVGI